MNKQTFFWNESYGPLERSHNRQYLLNLLKKTAPRVFPQLPYSKVNLKYLEEFHFQESVLSDSEYNQFCQIRIENKKCYATHRMMLEEFLLRFGLDWNLMLNCKHKDLPKLLLITGESWIFYWMICTKKWIAKQIG